jgi:hypothetical protein
MYNFRWTLLQVEKKQKKKLLLDYLYDNLKNHNWWAYRYFFCELLALLNVLGTVHMHVLYSVHCTVWIAGRYNRL